MKISKRTLVGASSAVLCVLVMCLLYFTMAPPQKKKVRTRGESRGEPRGVAPTSPALVTTTAPDIQAINEDDPGDPVLNHIRVGGMTVLYPRVPLLEMQYNPKRYELVPGAILPGMRGRRVEDATHVIATTYPGLIVRVVGQAEPLNLEVRRDRVTLVVDMYTKRVMSARIG